jgi:hypothetical protein
MPSAALELLITLKDEASAGLGSLAGSLTTIGGLAAGGVIAGFGAAGVAAFSFASEAQQGVNDLQASLGVTRAEAEELGDVAQSVFADNWGSGLSDVNASIITVRQQMRGLNDEDLSGATASALALRDTFGVDVAESTNAANTLMQQFGLSQQQAFDFITKGFQTGLNASDDFLASIGEYSPQFAGMEADAGQFFSALETGISGGMLGTDKVADLFKETRLRISEETDATREALTAIGINADQFYADLRSGALTGIDAFSQIQDGLRNTVDPIAQNTAAVALMGTQWEDLGAAAVLGVDIGTASIEDMAGATDSLNAKYNNLGAVFEGVRRRALVAIAPIGEELLGVANEIMPQVDAGFTWFEGVLPGLMERVGTGARQMGDAVRGGLAWLTDTGLPLATQGWALLQQGAAQVTPIFERIAGVVAPLRDALAPLRTTLGDVWGTFADAGPMTIEMDEALSALPERLGDLRIRVVETIGAAVPEIVAAVQPWSLALLDWIVEAAPGMLARFATMQQQFLEAVGAAVPGIVEALAGWAAALIDWTIDAAPGLMGQLGLVVANVLAWAADQVGPIAAQLGEWAVQFLGWVGPTIPRLIGALGEMVGSLLTYIYDNREPILEQLGAWASAFGEWAATQGLPALAQALLDIGGGIAGIIGDKWQAAFAEGSLGASMIEGIKQSITGAWDGFIGWLAELVRGAAGGIAAFFTGGQSVPGFANGVSNFGGGLALVGERGPELVNLPRGSDVIPSGAFGGGGTTIAIGTLTVPVPAGVTDARAFARELYPALMEEAARQRGRNGSTGL